MRVAVVSESFLPTVNGVTTSVRHVLDHLQRCGHEAIVIVPSAGAPRQYAGFPVIEVPALAYRQFPVGMPSPLVGRVLAEFTPDVLHAASPFLLGAQAIAAAGRLNIPSVAIFQTDVAGYAKSNRLGVATGFAWRMVRRIHDGADVTLVPSSASMAHLTSAGVARLARWGRGVDLDRYNPRNRNSAASLRLRHRIAPHGETIVGYVGRIAPEKQVDRMRALANMEGIRLAIVGDGPSLPQVRKRLAGMPVSWLGSRSGEELADAFGAFDVFLHTGAEETFGQTIQEAHANGLPVVAPRSGGPIDLVADGIDGFLYDPASDDHMRMAILAIKDDPELRARMGEAGRRAVLNRSWGTVCDELIAHYENAILQRATIGSAR